MNGDPAQAWFIAGTIPFMLGGGLHVFATLLDTVRGHAAISNLATIGDDSIVGARSLVTEGAVIPPRSLVMGSPARVKRPLTDDEVASIVEYAANYVRYKKDYE